MALNSIGLIEGSPGASRLEIASMQEEQAQLLHQASYCHRELSNNHGILRQDAQNALRVSDSYLGTPRSEIIQNKWDAADAESQNYGEAVNAFTEANRLEKVAKRNRRIGKIQQLCGKIIGRRARSIPILVH